MIFDQGYTSGLQIMAMNLRVVLSESGGFRDCGGAWNVLLLSVSVRLIPDGFER